jgi:hypothetical protein
VSMTEAENETDADGKIACRICGHRTHILKLHLNEHHPGLTEAQYQADYPGAPMFSPVALRKLEEQRVSKAVLASPAIVSESDPMAVTMGKGNLHEVFGLGTAKAAFNKRTGAPLQVTTIVAGKGLAHFVPDKDPAYVFNIDLTYQADEYDFGMPSVLAVYQPVLEGKPLVIKEADEENRVIRPHPNFRMVGTGNTNGQGDETGLYQGTLLQNAANYERFGIVEEVKYMDAKAEVQVIAGQAGVPKEIAEKLVTLATQCRQAFADQKLGLPPSPRAMIKAAKQGRVLGDWVAGIKLAYVNRLSRTDQVAVGELLKRVAF